MAILKLVTFGDIGAKKPTSEELRQEGAELCKLAHRLKGRVEELAIAQRN